MIFGTIFELFTDGKDLAEFFEGVETKEQLVSRLEILKHKDTDDLLNCIVGLRASLDQTYKDTLEMSASLPDHEDLDIDFDDESVDKTLAELESEFPDLPDDAPSENPISSPGDTGGEAKSVETPES